MTDHDYGPLRTYEVIWRNRAPEMIQGHSVQFDSNSIFGAPPTAPPKIRIYGMFPGQQWRMLLMAPEEDISVIRDVTEQVEALEAINNSEADQ